MSTTTIETVTKRQMVDIEVPADPNQDDCLAAAVDAYVADHPDLAGWDLSPRWTDDADRTTVTLTVPVSP